MKNTVSLINKHWIYTVSFVVPGFLLIVDLTLLGSGFWSEPLGVSVRKLAFGSVCLYSVNQWIGCNHGKKYELIAILGLIIFILIWSLGIPVIKSNSIANAINDAQLFFGLLFAPAIYSVLKQRNRWAKVSKWIFKLIILLACIHVLIALVDFLAPEVTIPLIILVKLILEPLRDEAGTSVFIGYVGENFRVFWGSSVFLLIGFYFSVKNFRKDSFFKSSLIIGLMIIATSVTLTRGIILSLPIFLISAWFVRRILMLSITINKLSWVFGVSLSAITLPIILLSDPTVLSTLGIGRDISDDVRSEQIFLLLDSISSFPFIGSGFGASVGDIRSESAPWSYEMSILALYMKIGILGTLFLLVTFFFFCRMGITKKLNGKSRIDFSRVAALGVVITFCSNTNPYLFSMLGVGLILFLYFEFRVIYENSEPTLFLKIIS